MMLVPLPPGLLAVAWLLLSLLFLVLALPAAAAAGAPSCPWMLLSFLLLHVRLSLPLLIGAQLAKGLSAGAAVTVSNPVVDPDSPTAAAAAAALRVFDLVPCPLLGDSEIRKLCSLRALL
jgi:hypothetical protein